MSAEICEIGAAQPRELDAILETLCEAFQMDQNAARPVFYTDPYFNLENKRVLRIKGRIVSCLTIVERECRIGYANVKVGGIAGVATRVAERNHGYAGRLLADTVRILKQRGIGLSALIPATQGIYRRYGWEIASNGYRYLTVPTHLPSFPERQQVRTARNEDIPHLSHIYDNWIGDRTFHCLRDADRWQYILDNVKQRVVYTDSMGEIEGYLLYDFHTTNMGEIETPGMALPPTLRIIEMRATTEPARRGLIGFLSNQSQAGCIETTALPEDFLRNGLLGLQGAGTTLDALASIEIVPGLMARIIDPILLLKQLKDTWSNVFGTLQIEIRDPLVEGGVSSVRVEGNGKTPRIRPGGNTASGQEPERIQGDIRVWSQVMTGYMSADDACALGLLQPLTVYARPLASHLFPRRSPFLPLTDHF